MRRQLSGFLSAISNLPARPISSVLPGALEVPSYAFHRPCWPSSRFHLRQLLHKDLHNVGEHLTSDLVSASVTQRTRLAWAEYLASFESPEGRCFPDFGEPNITTEAEDDGFSPLAVVIVFNVAQGMRRTSRHRQSPLRRGGVFAAPPTKFDSLPSSKGWMDDVNQ